jgi:hypothetical protein
MISMPLGIVLVHSRMQKDALASNALEMSRLRASPPWLTAQVIAN